MRKFQETGKMKVHLFQLHYKAIANIK